MTGIQPVLRALVLVTAFTGVSACVGSGDTAEAALASDAGQRVDPFDDSPGTIERLTLSGVSLNSLNPTSVELRYVLKGASFDVATDEVSVSINGQLLGVSAISVSPLAIVANAVLSDGKNEVSLRTYDEAGRRVHLSRTVWAGGNSLGIHIVDDTGAPVLQPVTVKLRLSDNPTIETSATTSTGALAFQSVPSGTVMLEARTSTNLLGTSEGLGAEGNITVRMQGNDTTGTPDTNRPFRTTVDRTDSGPLLPTGSSS